MWQKSNEVHGAEPRDSIFGAQRLAKTLSDDLQQPIDSAPSEDVAQIDVQKGHRARLPSCSKALRMRHSDLQAILKNRLVRQAGDHIMKSLILDLLFRPLPFRDVARYGDDFRYRVVYIADRSPGRLDPHVSGIVAPHA